MANIGFQGMSVRTKDKLTAPALQVLLGGGNNGNGQGVYADKVVKIPSRRGPEALRRILNDFEANANGKTFQEYYAAQGEKYFYTLLTDLSSVDDLTQEDFIDWGEEEKYVKAIGVGECAGVVIDLIETLFLECDEKIENARQSLNDAVYSNAIYYAYSSLINASKAILISDGQRTNTQAGIVKQFDELYVTTDKIPLGTSFHNLIYQIQEYAPSEEFATSYIKIAAQFLQKVRAYRVAELVS
jgi:sulfite reductase (ferredoxin)